jgi:hypothetical protein
MRVNGFPDGGWRSHSEKAALLIFNAKNTDDNSSTDDQ